MHLRAGKENIIMAKQDWLEWFPPAWGTKVEVDPDFIDDLRGA